MLMILIGDLHCDNYFEISVVKEGAVVKDYYCVDNVRELPLSARLAITLEHGEDAVSLPKGTLLPYAFTQNKGKGHNG